LKLCRLKHPFVENLKPTPPLYASSILFLLAIFLLAGAFRNYYTIQDVLYAKPPPRDKFWIMDWLDDVLDDLVYPEMNLDGPAKKVKNKNA